MTLTVHPRGKCQIGGKCQFPARFASVLKSETGFGILTVHPRGKCQIGGKCQFPARFASVLKSETGFGILTVHPRGKCQIGGKCQFPARFASVLKSETGFGILVKNRVGWRIYFPEKVSLKISVDFDRGRFRVTCSFSRCGIWIFGFPGVDYPNSPSSWKMPNRWKMPIPGPFRVRFEIGDRIRNQRGKSSWMAYLLSRKG